MSLSAAEIAECQADLTEIGEQLTLANATYKKLLAKDIAEYRFDSNEGSQRARRVELKQFKDQIDSLRAERNRINRKLAGGGLAHVNLRRQ